MTTALLGDAAASEQPEPEPGSDMEAAPRGQRSDSVDSLADPYLAKRDDPGICTPQKSILR